MGSAVFGQEVLSLFLFPFSSPPCDGAQQTPPAPSRSRVVPGGGSAFLSWVGGWWHLGDWDPGDSGPLWDPGTQWCFGIPAKMGILLGAQWDL